MAASLLLIALQVFTVTQTALSQGTIPTHYGDPKTGCESDEQSVKVQGLSGDFCSAACKGSECPTDKPSGATAKPTCALKTTTGSQYCALICSPSALSLNGANGECGTGTCQSVQGTGICTYARSTKLALTPVLIVAEMIQANPTHYGDPKTGCMRDEGRHWGGGLSGWYCSPVCKDDPCPTDKPSGVTAKPGCTDKDDEGYGICTLICSPSAVNLNGAKGECGTGTCESFPGSSTGECRYAEPLELAVPPVLIGAEMIQANPTHYGDPKTGCESDEQSVKVQGLSGDFCSAACKGSVCPTDTPSGATAEPTCALKTTTGSQYCALICSPSALRLNGANGECGTGTCQSVQGTGICTYATSTKLALPPATMVAEMIQAGGPSVIV